MNAVTTPTYAQPEFAENIATAVLSRFTEKYEMEKNDNLLTITRPDYARPIGASNLYRTSYAMSVPLAPDDVRKTIELRQVHVSNILYGEDRDTINVVFETKANVAPDGTVITPARSLTRHFVGSEKWAKMKEAAAQDKTQAVKLITHGDEATLVTLIDDFLFIGNLPK
jgi:hypothetical protein